MNGVARQGSGGDIVGCSIRRPLSCTHPERSVVNRRAPKSTDPHGIRRELVAYGQMQANGADAKREKEEGRKDDLRHAILAVLPEGAAGPNTRQDLEEAAGGGQTRINSLGSI